MTVKKGTEGNRIILKNISKVYTHNGPEVRALEVLNTTFEQGKEYIISGDSGSGKSTLLHIVANILAPTTGSVWYNGVNLTAGPQEKQTLWRKEEVGILFQSPFLLSELSVLENVMVPGMIAGRSAEEIENRAVELLNYVGLMHKLPTCSDNLSGGEQQRVALARALFNMPPFLLADEPTAHLDRRRADAIWEMLVQCKHDYGMGLIVATHDQNILKREDSMPTTTNKLYLSTNQESMQL